MLIIKEHPPAYRNNILHKTYFHKFYYINSFIKIQYTEKLHDILYDYIWLHTKRANIINFSILKNKN